MSTPSTAQSGQPKGKPGDGKVDLSYKERLDAAAEHVKAQNANANADRGNEEGILSQVVEKVSQYVPAAGHILSRGEQESSTPLAGNGDGDECKVRIPGPPERPNHDTQIEEFVRDQHRSKQEDGTLAGQ